MNGEEVNLEKAKMVFHLEDKEDSGVIISEGLFTELLEQKQEKNI